MPVRRAAGARLLTGAPQIRVPGRQEVAHWHAVDRQIVRGAEPVARSDISARKKMK